MVALNMVMSCRRCEARMQCSEMRWLSVFCCCHAQAAYEPGKGVGDMSEVLAMLLDWATREGEDLRLFTFDFNKFFDR